MTTNWNTNRHRGTSRDHITILEDALREDFLKTCPDDGPVPNDWYTGDLRNLHYAANEFHGHYDRLRCQTQLNEVDWLPADKLKRFFDKTEETILVWHRLNLLNGVTTEDIIGIVRDCFKGDTNVSWAHIVPVCERWINGMMIWLRENRVVSSDQILAEKRKINFLNLAPVIKWFAPRMEYQEGGLLFFPTKQCLWRLCLLSQATLVEAAQTKGNHFSSFRVHQLFKGKWDMAIKEDAAFKGYAKGYLAAYEDYPPEHLSISNVINMQQIAVEGVSTDVLIYDYHFIIVDNEHTAETPVQPTRHSSNKPFELVRKVTTLDDEGNTTKFLEDITWTQTRADTGEKHLPQHTYRARLNLTDISVEHGTVDVGPTLFVPFDPISSVLMFWHTIQRLLYDKDANHVLHGSAIKELMDLADFFLRLVQCITADQVYDVTPPECWGEEHLVRPTGPKAVNNRQARMLYRDCKAEQQLSCAIKWRPHYHHKQEAEIHAAKAEKVNEASYVVADERLLLHTDAQKSLAAVKDRISEIQLEKQARFDNWVRQFGMFEALDRQRLEQAFKEDRQLDHLWSEGLRLKEEIKTGAGVCNGHCFSDICSEYAGPLSQKDAISKGNETVSAQDTESAKELATADESEKARALMTVHDISDDAYHGTAVHDASAKVERKTITRRIALVQAFYRHRERVREQRERLSNWLSTVRNADPPASLEGPLEELELLEPTEKEEM